MNTIHTRSSTDAVRFYLAFGIENGSRHLWLSLLSCSTFMLQRQHESNEFTSDQDPVIGAGSKILRMGSSVVGVQGHRLHNPAAPPQLLELGEDPSALLRNAGSGVFVLLEHLQERRVVEEDVVVAHVAKVHRRRSVHCVAGDDELHAVKRMHRSGNKTSRGRTGTASASVDEQM